MLPEWDFRMTETTGEAKERDGRKGEESTYYERNQFTRQN